MSDAPGPIAPDALSRWLGLSVVSPAEARLRITPELVNGIGMLLGPVVLALADYGMGAAAWATLQPGEQAATVDLALSFLASATAGDVVCRSSVHGRSRRLVRTRCEIRHEDGRLLATAIGTFAVLERRDADAG